MDYGNHSLYQAYPTDGRIWQNTVTGATDGYEIWATLIGERVDNQGNHVIQWAWLKADGKTLIYFYTNDQTTTHGGKGFNAANLWSEHPEARFKIDMKDLSPGLICGLNFTPAEFAKHQNNTGQPLNILTEDTLNLATIPHAQQVLLPIPSPAPGK